MGNLTALFEYQKIAGNERMDKLISETEERMGIGHELSDEELGLVAAGKKKYVKPDNKDISMI